MLNRCRYRSRIMLQTTFLCCILSKNEIIFRKRPLAKVCSGTQKCKAQMAALKKSDAQDTVFFLEHIAAENVESLHRRCWND